MNKSNDGPVVTSRAGQNFPEFPGDRHTVDENASKTEPAKLLAVFVMDFLPLPNQWHRNDYACAINPAGIRLTLPQRTRGNAHL
jgi:hypothetical protein